VEHAFADAMERVARVSPGAVGEDAPGFELFELPCGAPFRCRSAADAVALLREAREAGQRVELPVSESASVALAVPARDFLLQLHSRLGGPWQVTFSAVAGTNWKAPAGVPMFNRVGASQKFGSQVYRLMCGVLQTEHGRPPLTAATAGLTFGPPLPGCEVPFMAPDSTPKRGGG
jgi:hypothetical protein